MDAARASAWDGATVGEPRDLHLVLELKAETEPISGWIEADGGRRSEFVGLLALVSQLEAH